MPSPTAGATAMGTPSRIPLPTSFQRAGSEENTSQSRIPRASKLPSPERTLPTLVGGGAGDSPYHRRGHSSPSRGKENFIEAYPATPKASASPINTATFVRSKMSPQSSQMQLHYDVGGEHGNMSGAAVAPASLDLDDALNAKVREGRQQQMMYGSGIPRRKESNGSNGSPTRRLSTSSSNNGGTPSALLSPSRIPVVDFSAHKPRSSSVSDGSCSSNRSSPSRQTSPSRRLSPTRGRSSSPSKAADGCSQIPLPTSPAKSAVGSSLDHRPMLKEREKEAVAAMLDLASGSSSSTSTPSRIPLPKSSSASSHLSSISTPVRQNGSSGGSSRASPARDRVPTVGWSLSPERMLPEEEPREVKDNHNHGMQTVEAPVGCGKKKKKQYEAFMMTGDRMINLAKTPANSAFKSKHPKQQYQPASSSVSSLPLAEQEELGEDVAAVVTRRDPPVAKRSLVRNSKSEDQLNIDQSFGGYDDALLSPDHEEHSSGSVNALDTSGVRPLPESPDVMSCSLTTRRPSPPKARSSISTPQLRPLHALAGAAAHLVDDESMVDTNSLISCSEHYNAESVLENKLSPHSSSSPDTPEWSLLDSFHKKSNSMDVSISSKGEKVIISIAEQYAGEDNGTPKTLMSPNSNGGASSNGTITPEQDFKELLKETTAKSIPSPPSHNGERHGQQQASSPVHLPSTVPPVMPSNLSCSSILSNASSEEDNSSSSDLDSLHSYHPPAKVIDVPSAVRLAKRLFALDGFQRSDVSRQLSRNTDYYHVVAEEYLKFFDFTDLNLDISLRQFLDHFSLAGETQERERVLLYFSKRYLECNAGLLGPVFGSSDAVHTLTCAIMLLNTDLHGGDVPRKMTASEFVENLSDLNGGKNFPKDLLLKVYTAIRDRPIPWVDDDSGQAQKQLQQQQQRSDIEKDNHQTPATAATSSVSIGMGGQGGVNPFLSLPDPSQATDYKNGYVMRKSCFDPAGKRTKMGKRGWKMFFLTLRDMVLYCFKDEKTVRAPGAFEDSTNAVRVHHGLAVRASDYTKKQFVFRLHTADRAQYLFQASDGKELLTWIDAINYVVASFSAPQLPAPCGSGGRFQRPLLPSAATKLSPQEQLESHEGQLLQLREDIEDHLQRRPVSGSKASKAEVASYKEKTEHLQFEIMRYETYVLTLRTKNNELG